MINHRENIPGLYHKMSNTDFTKVNTSAEAPLTEYTQNTSHHGLSEHTQKIAEKKITSLPNELVSKILINLNKEDIVLCKQVSQTWQAIIEDHHLIARCFSLDNHYDPSPKTVERYDSFTRNWLISFGSEGEALTKQLDQFLEYKYFPEMLFHGIAQLLNRTNLIYEKVFQTEYLSWKTITERSNDGWRIMAATNQCIRTLHFNGNQWQIEFFPSEHVTELDSITSTALAPDGNHLITIINHQTMNIWEIDNQQWILQSSVCHCDAVDFIKFSPRGDYLVVNYKQMATAEIWEYADAQWQVKNTIMHDSMKSTITFSPSGSLLTSVSEKKM